MEDKCTDSSYKCSHQKSAKSFTKGPCKALDIKQRIGQNSQLHSFTASQLHSFTASQLHSFTAEGFLCPNKFKYQLLKPRPKIGRQPKTECLSLGFFHTPFNKTATDAKNAKEYKRMSYKTSLKTPLRS